jgi:hypothetical protein
MIEMPTDSIKTFDVPSLILLPIVNILLGALLYSILEFISSMQYKYSNMDM